MNRPLKRNLLYKINWKQVVRDTVKFYFYLTTLYALSFLLVWGQGYIELDNYKMTLEQVMSDSAPMATETFNILRHKILFVLMGYGMFVLACFGTFFTVPARELKGLFFSAMTIAIVMAVFFNAIYAYNLFLVWLLLVAWLFGHILFVWLCSVSWSKMKKVI